MFYARLAWAIFSIALFGILRWVLLVLPGYFLVWLAILFSREEASPVTGRAIINAPRWLWLWGNDQEGYLPYWYSVKYHPRLHWVLRAYLWAAWRNPANNLRFVKWINPPADPEKVKISNRGNLSLLWDGWRYRILWYPKPRVGVLVGWKYSMFPEEYAPWQSQGVGFGIRIKRY